MIVDVLQVRTNSSYLYASYENSLSYISTKHNDTDKMQEVRKLAYQGRLTKSSRKRLTKACEVLNEMSKKRKVYNEVSKRAVYFKLSMITLTISTIDKKLTPKQGNSLLLKHFLRWLTRTKGATGYVWKCEHQSNGQIHYHILTNVFVNYQEIRDKWNHLQQRNGLLDDYYNKYKHYDPNSTDVHAIKNVKNITAYFISYLKAEKNDKATTDGKIWDCSYNIKKAKHYTCIPDSETVKNIEEGITKGEIERVDLEHIICFHFYKKAAKFYLSERQYKEYLKHYAEIATQPTEPPDRKPVKIQPTQFSISKKFNRFAC